MQLGVSEAGRIDHLIKFRPRQRGSGIEVASGCFYHNLLGSVCGYWSGSGASQIVSRQLPLAAGEQALTE